MAIKKELGAIEEITDLRSVWDNEAQDFTPWVAENIELLGNALDLNLNVIERESAVGRFSLDILAQDEDTEAYVVIENQIEESDHEHLGKLLTYAAGKEAKYIIWIVKKAKEEHRATIQWLNSNTSEEVGFFLVEIKLWTINGVDIAPKFEIIEQPNNWSKIIKSESKGSSGEAVKKKYAFWTAFNEHADNSSKYKKLAKVHKASSDHWYTIAIGISGVHLNLLINTLQNSIAVELYISDDKELYDKLFAAKSEIEASAGLQFDWRRMDDKKSSRILIERIGNVSNPTADEFDWLIDTATKMKKAFLPFMR